MDQYMRLFWTAQISTQVHILLLITCGYGTHHALIEGLQDGSEQGHSSHHCPPARAVLCVLLFICFVVWPFWFAQIGSMCSMKRTALCWLSARYCGTFRPSCKMWTRLLSPRFIHLLGFSPHLESMSRSLILPSVCSPQRIKRHGFNCAKYLQRTTQMLHVCSSLAMHCSSSASMTPCLFVKVLTTSATTGAEKTW